VKVAELFAVFSVRPDLSSLRETNSAIRAIRNSVLGLGTIFGAGALLKSMLGFNMRVEDAKNSIAGMIALVRGTTVTDELQTASKLYDDIRQKAAELPGTTEEYLQVLQKLTRPVLAAGGSLEDLKKITIATAVAAKAGVGGSTIKTATTDVLQGIGGRFAVNDFFLQAVLGKKFKGEEGRKRFRGLSEKDRFKTLLAELNNPVFVELANRQADSFSGRLDKVKEQLLQFLGRVGIPLFKALGNAFERANVWLTNNQAAVQRFADTVGGAFATAFGLISDIIKFFVENSPEAQSLLFGLGVAAAFFAARIGVAWLAVLGPVGRIVAAIALIHYTFNQLKDKIGELGAALVAAFSIFAAARVVKIVGGITQVTKAMLGLQVATKGVAAANALAGIGGTAATAASAAGAAINAGALAGGLGPAGAGAAGAGGLFGRLGLALGSIGTVPIIGAVIGTAYALSEVTGGAMDLARALEVVREQEINRRYEQAKAAGITVTTDVHVNVTGMMSGDTLVEFRRVIEEEAENQLRHIQAAVAGGTR